MLARRPGPFELVGRADRIDRRADGRLAIVDYKTGTLPERRAMSSTASRRNLPLEAAIAEAGGFAHVPAAAVAELASGT